MAEMVMIGCAPIAGMFRELGDEAAAKAITSAVDHKFLNFDTAPHYGLGLSEERLGRALRLHPNKSVRVWTKVGRVIVPASSIATDAANKTDASTYGPDAKIEADNVASHPDCIFTETPPDVVPVLDYSYDGVMRSYRDSLRRLGMEQIYGLRVHDADTEERFAQFVDKETGGWRALVELRQSGQVQDIGLGLNDPSFIIRLIEAVPEGTFDSVMMAGCWNLIDQSGEDVLVLCQKRGIRVHIAGAFASGLLVGGTTVRYKPASDDMLVLRRRWESFAQMAGVPLAALAIAFAMLPRCVTHIAVGIREAEEVQQLAETVKRAASLNAPVWESAINEGLLTTDILRVYKSFSSE